MDVTTRDFRLLLKEDHGCSIIRSDEINDFIEFLRESEMKENIGGQVQTKTPESKV